MHSPVGTASALTAKTSATIDRLAARTTRLSVAPMESASADCETAPNRQRVLMARFAAATVRVLNPLLRARRLSGVRLTVLCDASRLTSVSPMLQSARQRRRARRKRPRCARTAHASKRPTSVHPCFLVKKAPRSAATASAESTALARAVRPLGQFGARTRRLPRRPVFVSRTPANARDPILAHHSHRRRSSAMTVPARHRPLPVPEQRIARTPRPTVPLSAGMEAAGATRTNARLRLRVPRAARSVARTERASTRQRRLANPTPRLASAQLRRALRIGFAARAMPSAASQPNSAPSTTAVLLGNGSALQRARASPMSRRAAVAAR